jgi:hypothetical protein
MPNAHQISPCQSLGPEMGINTQLASVLVAPPPPDGSRPAIWTATGPGCAGTSRRAE